jgi:hypothetical protein
MKLPLSAARIWVLRLSLITAMACFVPVAAHAQDRQASKSGNSALTGELLYQILLGEMNLRHGEPAAGFSLLLDAARKSNDAQLYDRAVEIALQARRQLAQIATLHEAAEGGLLAVEKVAGFAGRHDRSARPENPVEVG